jgi:protoporphyrinogen oxidase
MAGTGIAIIGTGYSGLSAAYELVRHGQRPVVFESGRVAGGLAECFRFAGTHLEKYYHHWFNHDEDMLRLVRELGLAKHLVRRQTTTSTYYDGKIYRLSSPTDLMRFRPLSMTDRLRLGRMVMRGRRIRDYHVLEGITARRWITETAGQTVYDVVWRPLLEGKFGRHADEISAVWFWSKLRTRGRSRSRRLAEELLYIDGGMQRVTTAMVDVVRTGGGQIRLGCPVKTVRRVDGEWEILTATGAERFAKVLVTAPTPIAMSLLEEMPDAVRRRSESIPYPRPTG